MSNSPEKKRVRLTVPTPESFVPLVTSTKNPRSAAKKLISEAVASQHDATKPMLSMRANEYLDLYETLVKQQVNLEKMNRDGFVARSLQFKFELVGSKRISNDAAFKELRDLASETLSACKTSIMGNLCSAVELDIAAIKKLLVDHLAHSIDILVDLEKTQLPGLSTEELAVSAHDAIKLFDRTTPWIDQELLLPRIATKYSVPDDPPAPNPWARGPAALTSLVSELFINPIKLYKSQAEFNKMSSDLEQMSKAYVLESDAADVDAIISDVQDANSETLSCLVNKKVEERLAEMTQRMTALSAQLKDMGGSSKPPKKTGTKNQSKTPPKDAGRNQDAPANDSTGNRPKKKKKKTTPNSKST